MCVLTSIFLSISADNAAAPVPATATESDQDVMVVVTPVRDYYITKMKFTRPVQETCKAASAELLI